MPEEDRLFGLGRGLRAVLFDAGNTLIHMPWAAEELLTEACLELGFAVTREQALGALRESDRYHSERYLSRTGDDDEAFWRGYHGAALRHLGIDDPTGERAGFLSYRFGLPHVWQPYSDARDACVRLKGLGLALGVVSNGSARVSKLLFQADLLGYLDAVISSQTAGVEKPDPAIFRAALEKLHVRAEEAIFVGDLYDVDVRGARAAGIEAVLLDRQGTETGRDCPVVRDLNEVVALVEERVAR